MAVLATERRFDSQATWVIAVLGLLVFGILSMCVCTARHWQRSGRFVQKLNVRLVVVSIEWLPTLMSVWSKALSLTASCLSPLCKGSYPTRCMWERCQWLWFRRWFLQGTPVSSTSYNSQYGINVTKNKIPNSKLSIECWLVAVASFHTVMYMLQIRVVSG